MSVVGEYRYETAAGWSKWRRFFHAHFELNNFTIDGKRFDASAVEMRIREKKP